MTLSVAMIVAGRKIKARTSRTYCLVIAGIECMVLPFGTILGIFTLVTLTKDSVVQIFTPGQTLPGTVPNPPVQHPQEHEDQV
jgi:hypothetical protein